uniref:Uncharacterized protein n=1 Tax=Rhizophora mucronata TaxID=61149 RepID=A0A2P2NML8_RHIMU
MVSEPVNYWANCCPANTSHLHQECGSL